MNKKNISYFTLGTAQLGMDYGIANTTGMPEEKNAVKILKEALNKGVNCFDTSYLYGRSENIIGDFITKNREKRNSIIINSKMPGIDVSDEHIIYKKIKEYIISSMRNMKINTIDMYMMHNAGDLYAFNGCVVKNLIKAKEEGLIGTIGASVYYPEEAATILDIEEIKAVQLPFNVFDTRFYSSGILDELKKKDKVIFARSVFLQGLFFLEERKAEKRIPESGVFVKKISDLAEKMGMKVDELAVRFLKSFPEIDSLVLGAETVSQVQRNSDLVKKDGFHPEEKKKIIEIFSQVPERIFLPIKWEDKP